MNSICDEEESKNGVEKCPKDRWNVVYIMFFVLGIAVLLPWNFFITADLYFKYQLRNRSFITEKDALNPQYRTNEQQTFPNKIAVCSFIPMAFMNIINLIIKDYISTFTRLIVSSILILVMFIVTVIMAAVSLDKLVFLSLTLVSVVFMNLGNSVNQGSTFGIVSVLPTRNGRSFLEGQAMAGIFASIANLITIAFSPNPVVNGLVFFSIALAIVVISIILYGFLFRNTFFQYFWKKSTNEAKKTFHDKGCNQLYATIIQLFRTMWEVRWPGICGFLNFAVTLTIFPSLLVLIIPNNYDVNDRWTSTYFAPVAIFLSFNVCDYFGRALTSFIKWPQPDAHKTLLVLCLFRVFLIPLVMFGNQTRKNYVPVLYDHQSVVILIVIILGLTNGYLLALCVSYAPRYASKGNVEACGIAMATYLSFGLCFGVGISYLIVAFL